MQNGSVDAGASTEANAQLTRRRQRIHHVAIALTVASIIVPLFIGLLTNSVLLGVAAFGVWTAMSFIGVGIWSSSQAESEHPSDIPQRRSTASTPQGWLISSDTVRRKEPPPEDEAARFDRRRFALALIALVLAGGGAAASLVFRDANSPSTGGYVFAMNVLWFVLSIGCLWSTKHNLRQGEPRPELDRPRLLTIFIGGQGLLLLLFFAMALPGAVWTIGAWLGLLLLAGSLVATVLWIVATGHRWSLSYAKRSNPQMNR